MNNVTNKLIDELIIEESPNLNLPANEAELKIRFNYGDWSIDCMDDFLDITNPVIRNTLRQISSHQCLNAIFPCSDKLKKHFLNNMSGCLGEMAKESLEGITPTKKESTQAQIALIETATEQMADCEKFRWQELMQQLPETQLAEEPNLDLLLPLDDEKTKLWMDSINTTQLINAVCLDDDWHELYQQKITYQLSERAKEMITDDIYNYRPQFAWEVEIARLLITSFANRIK